MISSPPSGRDEAVFEGGLRRREFLIGGIKVSLAFLACDAMGLPVFGQKDSAGKTSSRPIREANLSKIPNLDDSLKVIAAYLTQYSPPAGDFPANGKWKTTYDLIEWEGSPINARFFRRNRVIGGMEVIRRPGVGGGVDYDLKHSIRMQGFESFLQSTMQCSADRLPRLLQWKTRYESRPIGHPGSPLGLSEQGRHQGGALEIASAAGVRRFKTDRPVVPQWAVLDALRGAKADRSDLEIGPEFDLLHDLTSYRPHQRLVPYGVLELYLNDRRHTLHGFVQTGVGTEPTHTWVDAAGRPILLTGGLFSMALTSLQA